MLLGVDYTELEVEFQYVEETEQVLVLSDDAYNQHKVPMYLFRGHLPLLQGMLCVYLHTPCFSRSQIHFAIRRRKIYSHVIILKFRLD